MVTNILKYFDPKPGPTSNCYLPKTHIWVSYGRLASDRKQLARVIEDCGEKYSAGKVKTDYVRAHKWLSSSRRWTRVVRIQRWEILGEAIMRVPMHVWGEK